MVDPTVRDCWQIDAAQVHLAGAGWPDTFDRGPHDGCGWALGCPADQLDAQLYKLLIYEPGGFFASHRDTEKADGMIATLSISLPVAGAGGEIVVRHRGRERIIDHDRRRAVRAGGRRVLRRLRTRGQAGYRGGYRLSLVFNLCLRARRHGYAPHGAGLRPAGRPACQAVGRVGARAGREREARLGARARIQ